VSTRVLKNNSVYVRASRWLQYQAQGSTPLLTATAYLPARYFPDSAIRRFFGTLDLEAARTADEVQTSARYALGSGPTRYLLLEARALLAVISEGIVHLHDPSFRLRPSEILHVLDKLIIDVEQSESLYFSVTPECLPFVFSLVPPSHALIDVRENYVYQRVNGILLRGEPDAVRVLEGDFWRLFHAPTALTDRAKLADVLRRAVAHWDVGEPFDARVVPAPMQSGRDWERT
jgi:hypothetical protein